MLMAKNFRLTLSTTKTKFMVVGHSVTEEEKLPISVEDGVVEHVSEFQCLGSLITESGCMNEEVRNALPVLPKAFGAFGAMRRAMCRDQHLSVKTVTRKLDLGKEWAGQSSFCLQKVDPPANFVLLACAVYKELVLGCTRFQRGTRLIVRYSFPARYLFQTLRDTCFQRGILELPLAGFP